MKRLGLFLVLVAAGCSKPSAPPDATRTTQAPATSSAVAAPSASASAGGAAAPAAPATAAAAKPELPQNILIISVDSMRADMPWAGYERPIAPRLTALEKTCVSYTHSYSISSYTSMSLGGLLGGRIPSELKRDGYFFGTYHKENVFFPELLKAAGIHTASAHAHGYFTSAGFDQGFEKWEIVPGLKWNAQTDENVTSPKHEAIAERLLSDPGITGGGRFFAWFHFLDPHDQYVSHDKDGINYGRKLRDLYDGEVEYTDRHVGMLLDFVAKQPWARKTAIIVTSDHGEALGEHGQFKHGFEVWENLVRVPLFVCLPGGAPRRIDARRSAIDLAPTILELMGLPKDSHFAGNSLVPEILGGPAEEHDIVVDLPATSNNERRRGLLHDKYKIIGFGDAMYSKVFDIEADPGELSPLPKGDVTADMYKRLMDYNKTVKEVPSYACGKGCLEGTK